MGLKIAQSVYHYLFLIILGLKTLFLILVEATQTKHEDIYKLWHHHIIRYNAVAIVICVGNVFQLSYLIDFTCYRPPTHLQVTSKFFRNHVTRYISPNDSSTEFQCQILERSGLGEETCFPEGCMCTPPNKTLASARKETEQVMFDTLDNLFSNSNIKTDDIGILVVNCSLFSCTPSISDVIINKYKLRSNVKIIAVDLAKGLLQVHRNTCAIIFSTENLSAILLSNKNQDKRQAKYKLVHIVRTHCGSDNESYKCVNQCKDEAGKRGVLLSKTLMPVAGLALKTNISTLGRLVLPFSEQLRFLITMVTKRIFKNRKTKTYIPNFKLAFEHFCIHAGGRGIIDEMEKNLQLLPVHVEASRMTLHRFGNTSSSSVWYELAYIEAKGRMRKNDRVWQIALGSGFKCNSAVWVALKNVNLSSCNKGNPWRDCIHKYPV
ncbi:hypothetical protein MKW94_026848 [Papaver nudicaule]|uniref:3-ketoacyl-CoA synthase n=1 Tax=Papaver nudicaule TaxID=74823 RepID=A0AA41SKQ1_PAPNU|nr:hypothetical protein [Papaver nudicaule]